MRVYSKPTLPLSTIPLLALASTVSAQPCGDWVRGPGQGLAGLDNTPSAAHIWQPPGAPAPVLLVGGFFSHAGRVDAPHIAAWDGQQWSPFAPGLAGGNSIQVIAEYDGQVVIGGSITTANGHPINRIARWDGAQWHAFGHGMNDVVYGLVEHQGDLFAAGAFTVAGGQPANRIARWNGSQWLAVGQGVNDAVYDMRLWNNQLHIAGAFTASGTKQVQRLARWDGSEWHEIGRGLNGLAYSITEYDGDLVVGGAFTQFQQSDGSTTAARRILRWNGQTGSEIGEGFSSTVRQVAVAGDRLIAGGAFTTAGPFGHRGLARWNAAISEWQPIGSAFNSSNVNTIRMIAGFQGELIVGGAFASIGGTGSRHIARWDEVSWRPLGEAPDAIVYDIAEAPGGGLHLASRFGMFEDKPPIAHFDGQWSRVGEGLTGTGKHLAHHQGDLILGGAFEDTGPGTLRHIARFDGGQWLPLAPALESLSMVSVETTLDFDGSLYIGGEFVTTHPCWRFGRWDGAQWHCINADGPIMSLAEFNGNLYAGGAFTNIDGVPARFFAWWNGVQWQPLANNLTNGYIHSMVVYDGKLILGGSFNRIGDTHGLNRMAAWDGQTFSPLGAGMDDAVEAVVLFRGDLVAGGSFTTAGGAPASRIARWDGQSWSPMGAGLAAGHVRTLRVIGNRLEVGGQFLSAGGLHTQNWATWSEEPPSIESHPAAQSACRGDSASFAIEAAGPGPLTYHWRKDGEPLSDGMAPGGALILGVHTPHLQITNISILDAGNYDCIVTSPCGSITSSAAALQMCYANCTCSAPPLLNIDDFLCFINEFSQAQALPPAQQITHYANCDGSTAQPILTIDDFLCFINAFATGCN